MRPDDTLYSVAWRHDLDYRDLARWNDIGADFHISVGQVLLLAPPRNGFREPPVGKPRPAPVAKPPPPMVPGPSAARPPIPAPPSTPDQRVNGTHSWVWPTDRIGAPRAAPGGGILLAGHLGQDVRAASAGRVVYTGSGLRGYGNLIIIKHADGLLSAYGHNREMLVREGQEVGAGQVIAHMGEGAGHAPLLYFEIRQSGKPIDPLPIISK